MPKNIRKFCQTTFSAIATALMVSLLYVHDALAGFLPFPLPIPGITPPDSGSIPKELTRAGTIRGGVLKIVNFALTFVGLIGVASIIYAGFLYLSSFGNPDNAGKAKKAILYVIIGIVFILLSWVITNTIIGIPVASERGAGGIGFPAN